MKSVENIVDFKKQLTEWINENLNHTKLQENKLKGLDIIDLFNWETLCGFSENQWSKLTESDGLGISIYNKIQEIKALNGF